MMGFDFGEKTAVLTDDAVHPFSMTSLSTLCRAVITILSSFEKVQNQVIHLSDGVITQEEFLDIIETALNEKWIRVSYPLVENKTRVVQSISEYDYTPVDQFLGILRTAFFGTKMVWEHNDNEMLGLGINNVDYKEEMARITRLRPKVDRVSESSTHSVR
jgi:hypothetical protein